MQKGVFDQVPQLVEMFVIFSLLLAVLSRRNLRFHALPMRLINDGVTVIALISEQMIRADALNQLASMRTVRVDT